MNEHIDKLTTLWKLVTGIKPWPQAVRAYLDHQTNHTERLFELRSSGLRFKTRSHVDIRNIKETFLDRIYERLGAVIGSPWTIIDIGGGIGDFTVYAASRHPDTVTYTFEPNPSAYALLEANLQLNDLSNARLFHKAVEGRSQEPPSSAAPHTPNESIAASPCNGGKPVDSISLADAFDQIGLAHCNLLKVDCCGAEYEILFNTPEYILSRTERIVLQYHDRHGAASPRDLAHFLESRGFAVNRYPNRARPRLGYLYASR